LPPEYSPVIIRAPMIGKALAEKMRAGERVYGTCTVSPTPRWVNAITPARPDFVFIDTEHNTLDRTQVGWMCQTYAALGIVPIVRLMSPDPYLAASTVDDGALGIVAPYIETVAQVDGLRGTVKNRPLKGQRLRERLEGKHASPEIDAYINERNANNVLIINIESQAAIDALDDLLASPEVDGVLIGPHDLSCTLGIPEQYDAPEFLAAVQTIFDKAREHDRGAGIHFWGSTEQQVRLLEMGCNFLIHSADVLLVRDHLKTGLNAVRERMGDQPQVEGGPGLVI
jgi:4-hydroxy-2-oxoheptanedioate aldolase